MNYTEKHRLPQWVKTDRIMMEDFNAAMANIEKGLNKTAQDAASATASAKQETASAAAAAQSTANAALAKANAAYSPDQPPYVVGSYRGNGGTQTIRVGFQPRFLAIGGGGSNYQILASPEVKTGEHLAFTSDGFTVKAVYQETIPGAPVGVAPYLCSSGTTYGYIAFR